MKDVGRLRAEMIMTMMIKMLKEVMNMRTEQGIMGRRRRCDEDSMFTAQRSRWSVDMKTSSITVLFRDDILTAAILFLGLGSRMKFANVRVPNPSFQVQPLVLEPAPRWPTLECRLWASNALFRPNLVCIFEPRGPKLGERGNLQIPS